MKPPAFQFYAADFLVGTATMTAEEVGAYIRLLCYQWDTGSIPDNDTHLARLGGCSNDCLAAIRTKFVPMSGVLKNQRMEKERIKQAEYRAAQSGNGKAGAEKRWHGGANGGAIATPIAKHMAKNSSPSPSPSPISDSDNPIPAAKPLTIADHIYLAYPRKVAKKAALNAIRSALKVKTADELLEAVKAYAAAVELWPAHERVKFVPHPPTWFNEGRYDDDRTQWVREATTQGRAGFA